VHQLEIKVLDIVDARCNHEVYSSWIYRWCGTPDTRALSWYCYVLLLVSDAKKVRASGRGLQPSGVRVGDVADFKIYTEGAGEGHPEVRVIGPGTRCCGLSQPTCCLIYHSCLPFWKWLCQKTECHVHRVSITSPVTSQVTEFIGSVAGRKVH